MDPLATQGRRLRTAAFFIPWQAEAGAWQRSRCAHVVLAEAGAGAGRLSGCYSLGRRTPSRASRRLGPRSSATRTSCSASHRAPWTAGGHCGRGARHGAGERGAGLCAPTCAAAALPGATRSCCAASTPACAPGAGVGAGARRRRRWRPRRAASTTPRWLRCALWRGLRAASHRTRRCDPPQLPVPVQLLRQRVCLTGPCAHPEASSWPRQECVAVCRCGWRC